MPFVATGCGGAPISASIESKQPQVIFQTDFAQASEDARRSGKPLLVVIKTNWCPFSHELLHETFANADVVRAGHDFVCVKLDAEQQPQLCASLAATRVYPTVQFISSSGEMLGSIAGSRTPKELLAKMRAVQLTSTQRILPVSVHR